ncbi:hypothetical protein BX600DRAFT_28060 [Xylariales sp. PMI_506]|nr:hypothetical protein BX600DRAFT_28060 [Xylariales sp. PMI_506]
MIELLRAADRLGAHGSPSKPPPELLSHLPPSFNLRDVAGITRGSAPSNSLPTLRALHACLLSDRLVKPEDTDSDDIKAIGEYVAQAVVPTASVSEADEDSTDWGFAAFKGELGLSILKIVSSAPLEGSLDFAALRSVTAYTDSRDPWTTDGAAAAAEALLAQHLSSAGAGDDLKSRFIMDELLAGFLRPLFSKSRPATVTASGRKAAFPEAAASSSSRYRPADEQASKPWADPQQQLYAVAVLAWAVAHADADAVLARRWHLFTPVLLTLLDEPGAGDLKVRSLGVLGTFWARLPRGLMDQVGLTEVFEQAVFPAVLYLPSLTPEDEAVRVLGAAYPVLFQIAGLAYPEDLIGEPTRTPDFSASQRKLLDKIIREGIMVGYHHAKEHIRLVELFCNKMQSIVNGIGILAVKHLKDLIPMIDEITTDPFGTKHPPALFAAIRLLQAIMRCCWPRVDAYCNEIIKILTVCYLNVEDEDGFLGDVPGRGEIKSQLARTADVLSAIMTSKGRDLAQTVSPLLEKEPLLGELFQAPGAH